MNDKLKEELAALYNILDQTVYIEPQKGDYIEVDENNVVHIKQADGTPIIMMHLDVYKEFLDWAEKEEETENVD